MQQHDRTTIWDLAIRIVDGNGAIAVAYNEIDSCNTEFHSFMCSPRSVVQHS